jgi:hypothetical protein
MNRFTSYRYCGNFGNNFQTGGVLTCCGTIIAEREREREREK